MQFLHSEQIRMAAGVNKFKNQNVVENPVNQKQIQQNMALAAAFKISCKLVVAESFGKFFAFCKKFNCGFQLF